MRIQTRHIYLADLNPTFGVEMRKERPVLVLQKQSTLRRTVIIAPISSKEYTHQKWEYHLQKNGRNRLYADSIVILDQLRAIDIRRCIGEIGYIDAKTYRAIVQYLVALFDY